MLKKKILLTLLSLTFGSALVAGNVVYATGNPAESHDETSPLRRVQEMEYSNISFLNVAHATECSECHKQVNMVDKDVKTHKHHGVKHVHHHKHHHRHVHTGKMKHHEKGMKETKEVNVKK